MTISWIARRFRRRAGVLSQSHPTMAAAGAGRWFSAGCSAACCWWCCL
jgi:hypothetical protein